MDSRLGVYKSLKKLGWEFFLTNIPCAIPKMAADTIKNQL